MIVGDYSFAMGEVGFLHAFRAIGRPYVWGAGSIVDADRCWPLGASTAQSEGVRGYDCSGFLIAAWMQYHPTRQSLLKLSNGRPDLGSSSIANICDPVYHLEIGDAVLYKRHVMLYVGNGMVIGATGGGSNDHGQNRKACVRVERFDYRGDIICGMRLKP
jgi:cell wall-associated NlpC family hydrolase